ncbi:MAG: hypothetical protein ACKVZH_22505 [Blastocatellia bacterium]
MPDSAASIESTLVPASPVRLSLGTKSLEASDLLFYGLLCFAMHVVLLAGNRLLVYRNLNDHIPAEFSAGYAATVYASMLVGVLVEAMFFLLGWLFICGMVVLLKGQSNSRLLFGGLLNCFWPVVASSAVAFVAYFFNLENLSYLAISEAQSDEQFTAAIDLFFAASLYQRIAIVQNIGYGAMILLAVEIIHRICQVPRWRSAISIMTYIALLMTLSRLAG